MACHILYLQANMSGWVPNTSRSHYTKLSPLYLQDAHRHRHQHQTPAATAQIIINLIAMCFVGAPKTRNKTQIASHSCWPANTMGVTLARARSCSCSYTCPWLELVMVEIVLRIVVVAVAVQDVRIGPSFPVVGPACRCKVALVPGRNGHIII